MKYLVIYTRNGELYRTECGDEKRERHYLNQGFTVAIFDEARTAANHLVDYAKMMNETFRK